MKSIERIYSKNLNNWPIIPTKEHLSLLRKWKREGDQHSFNLLYNSIIKYIPKIALSLKRRDNAHYMDLLQEGNLAVYNSLLSYDIDKYEGSVFSYSLRLAKIAMIHFLMRNESPVKMENSKYMRLYRDNRDATTEELEAIAKREGLNKKAFLQSCMVSARKRKNQQEHIIKCQEIDPEQVCIKADQEKMAVKKLKETISDERNRNLLLDYFFDDTTMTKVSKKYKMSRQAASSIIGRELKKLRKEMSND